MKTARTIRWLYRSVPIGDTVPMSERRVPRTKRHAEIMFTIAAEIARRGNNSGGVAGVTNVNYGLVDERGNRSGQRA